MISAVELLHLCWNKDVPDLEILLKVDSPTVGVTFALRREHGGHTQLIVAYQPTKGLPWELGPDWLSNLKLWKKKSDGPAPAWATAVDEFMVTAHHIDRFISIFHPDQVVLTGFSQGAAIATHAGLWTLSPYTHKTTVVLFAAPRVYGVSGAILFQKALTRWASQFEYFEFTHPADPIRAMPPWWLNFKRIQPIKNPQKMDPPVHQFGTYLGWVSSQGDINV